MTAGSGGRTTTTVREGSRFVAASLPKLAARASSTRRPVWAMRLCASPFSKKFWSSTFAYENLVLLPVTSSIGAVVFVGDDVAPVEVVSRADKALYQATRVGRDTFVVTHW